MDSKGWSVPPGPISDVTPYIRMCSELLNEIRKLEEQNKDLRHKQEYPDVKQWQTSYNQLSEKRHVSPGPGKSNDVMISSSSQTSFTQKVERYSPVPPRRNSPSVEYHQYGTTSKVIVDEQQNSSQNPPVFRKVGTVTEINEWKSDFKNEWRNDQKNNEPATGSRFYPLLKDVDTKSAHGSRSGQRIDFYKKVETVAGSEQKNNQRSKNDVVSSPSRSQAYLKSGVLHRNVTSQGVDAKKKETAGFVPIDRDHENEGYRMPFRPISADRDNRRSGTKEVTPSNSASRMTRQHRSVSYVTSPLPDGRFVVNKNQQEISTTVQTSAQTAFPRQDPIPPRYPVGTETVYRSVSFIQDESNTVEFGQGSFRAPSPRRTVFQSTVTTEYSADGRESQQMSRTLSLKQSEERPLPDAFVQASCVITSNSTHSVGGSRSRHITTETDTVDNVIQSYRCIGEIAFQLERRILDYVFRRNERNTLGVGSRRRFYGYTVSNIPSMISKEAEDANGIFSPKRDMEIRNRLTRIMLHLRKLGYDMAIHGLVAQNIINKYGLLSRIPAKNSTDSYWINDEESLRRMVNRLIFDEKEKAEVHLLLECLLLLAREDGKPIFLW